MEAGNGDGVDLRINTNCYLEGNYYKDSKKPIFGKPSENGQGKLVDNIFDNCARLHGGLTNLNGVKSDALSTSEEFTDACNFTPSDFYSYKAQLNQTMDVPAIVKTYSGVGKITENLTEVTSVPFKDYSVTSDSKGLLVHAIAGLKLSVFGIDGRQIFSTQLSQENTFVPFFQKGTSVRATHG